MDRFVDGQETLHSHLITDAEKDAAVISILRFCKSRGYGPDTAHMLADHLGVSIIETIRRQA